MPVAAITTGHIARTRLPVQLHASVSDQSSYGILPDELAPSGAQVCTYPCFTCLEGFRTGAAKVRSAFTVR
jgi:hypothetical protein